MGPRTLVVVCALGAACGAGGEDVGALRAPILAFCEAEVAGQGLLEVEGDYLAHVVACENGAASFEALKAQAVTARSYLYYKLERQGSIGDGQGDQVYSCARPPDAEHFQAVADTAGQVLRYHDTQVAAFYVAGARNQPPPGCVGSTDDPTDTEKWVTYNEGLSGDAVMQTALGFVSPTNWANRGCMSQNGSHCLAESGRGYDEILRFYYGADIELVTAEGPCVPTGGGGPDAGGGGDGGGGGGGGDGDGVEGGCGCRAGGRRGGAGGGGRALAAALALLVALGYARRFRADAP
jgi:hypothetical protein